MRQGVFNKAVVTIYGLPRTMKRTEEGLESAIADEGLYGQSFVELPWEQETSAEKAGNYGTAEDFIRIRTFYNYEGFVKREDVLFIDGKEDGTVCAGFSGSSSMWKPMWVTKAYADVLAVPHVSGCRIISLTRGAVIRVESEKSGDFKPRGCSNGYVCACLYDGRIGYIKASYVADCVPPVNGNAVEQTMEGSEPDMAWTSRDSIDEAAFRQAVVATAKSYLGTQYRWGGKSTLGIDCSGLTSMSYMLNGVIIYRDAGIKSGFPVHEIAYEDRKPGDLLYFPGHIAMYIGNEEYIHSTAKTGSDGVVINSLDPAAYNFRADLPGTLSAVGSIF